MTKWTSEETSRAVQSYEQGRSSCEIAEYLGKTTRAVHSKLYKLGKIPRWSRTRADMAREIKRLRELLTHAWNGGEVQNCEACGEWFRLEETHSMDEGGWICKGCASSAAPLLHQEPRSHR